MEIHLKLKRHCIKTAAKTEHNRLVMRYFSSDYPDNEKTVIEAQIEALKFFLEKADFARIRSVHPGLSGTGELPVSLKVPESLREMKIVFNGNKVRPEWK